MTSVLPELKGLPTGLVLDGRALYAAVCEQVSRMTCRHNSPTSRSADTTPTSLRPLDLLVLGAAV
jgi:hypothetical protein